MTATPRFTVVIATHNHARFLPRCLGCVRAQTYSDYEVVIVNNGSTDNTEELIRGLSWEQLRYHYQKDTGSVAGPRNTGIGLARGEYVAFLDSDDLWYPDKLEKVAAVLDKDPAIDILSHDLVCVREGKGRKVIHVGPLKPDMFEHLLADNRLLGSATVVRRSVFGEVGGFDPSPEFVHTEDYETWLRIAYAGKRFAFINEPLGEYLVHAGNLSWDFASVLKHERNVVEKHFRNYSSPVPFRKTYLYRTRLCLLYAKMGVQFFFRRSYAGAFANLIRAFLYNPMSFFSTVYRLLFS